MTPGELREAYATLTKSFCVENLILSNTRYVFVLESPHVEELKHGVPVAGRSGQSMTHVIFEGDFLTLLEAIRSRPASQTYRDERLNLIRELILADLRRQFQHLTQRELHIIPCGRVAQTFFSLAGVTGTGWDIHTGIPHPARNQWHRNEVATQIRALLPAASPSRPRSGESRV